MKKILMSTVVLMIMFGFAYAEDQTNNELTVIVEGIEGSEGQIAIGLFYSEENWGEEEFLGTYVEVTGLTITYIFKVIPQGTIAVAIYHDENMNEKLDTGLFKIPKEGYAFSNNVFGSFGPPKFESASFQLDGKKEIKIKIKYQFFISQRDT